MLLKPPLPYWIERWCEVCSGDDDSCDHTELRLALNHAIRNQKITLSSAAASRRRLQPSARLPDQEGLSDRGSCSAGTLDGPASL